MTDAPAEQPPSLDGLTPIEDLELDKRAMGVLRAMNISRVSQIWATDDRQFLRQPNCGQRTLFLIRYAAPLPKQPVRETFDAPAVEVQTAAPAPPGSAEELIERAVQRIVTRKLRRIVRREVMAAFDALAVGLQRHLDNEDEG